jgi:hypothetical protein
VEFVVEKVSLDRFLSDLNLVDLPVRGISPSQGLYLYRAAQHRNTSTNIQALSGIRIHYLSLQAIKAFASDRAATGTGSLLLLLPSLL